MIPIHSLSVDANIFNAIEVCANQKLQYHFHVLYYHLSLWFKRDQGLSKHRYLYAHNLYQYHQRHHDQQHPCKLCHNNSNTYSINEKTLIALIILVVVLRISATPFPLERYNQNNKTTSKFSKHGLAQNISFDHLLVQNFYYNFQYSLQRRKK